MKNGKPIRWLDVILGRVRAPKPPPLDSERIKHLAGKALLMPTAILPEETQEMAASIISHLVSAKRH